MTFSDRDTNILRPYQKVATSNEDTTTVEPSDIRESRSQLEVANGNLRESLQTRRTTITALEEERAILAKNLLILRAHISSSGAQMIAEREDNHAEPRNQEAKLANKMSILQQDVSGREDKIVEQEAKIAAMQQEKADLANQLKLVQSDFRQLEDLIQTERLNQVNELAYLEEQLVAFNQLIAYLEDENTQLKQIVDQQHLEDQMSDKSAFDEASSSDMDATDQSRIDQVEEENQSLKSKLIDTLDKLVAAQSRLEKFATGQTHAAGFPMPLESQQGTKRPGSVYNEPAAKKPKDLRPPNLEFLQSSSMSSEDHYLCLVPQQSVSGSEENVGYALKSILNSYVIDRVQSLIATFTKQSTNEGFSAWQSAAAMKKSCAFCRYISGKESEWYQDRRACARCTRNHRPCIVVLSNGAGDVAVLLPLTQDRRKQSKPSDTGYWIRI